MDENIIKLLILDLMIIICVYIIPIISFVRIIKFKRFSFLKKLMIVLLYIAAYMLIPSMYANALPFVFIVIIFIKWKKENYYGSDFNRYNFDIKKFRIGKALKYVLVAYLLIYLASFVSIIIFSKFNIEVKAQEIVSILDSYNMWAFLITIPFTVIFAPVVEEFVFRYMLFQKLMRDGSRRKIPFFIAAFLVSMLFAVIHNSLSALPLLFTLSFFNCYLMEKKGYWYCVFVHMFVNGVSMISLLTDKII